MTQPLGTGESVVATTRGATAIFGGIDGGGIGLGGGGIAGWVHVPVEEFQAFDGLAVLCPQVQPRSIEAPTPVRRPIPFHRRRFMRSPLKPKR